MNVVPIDRSAASEGAVARQDTEFSLVPPPAAGERARQLLREARLLSLDHLKALQEAVDAARQLSDSVVEAGELYGPGLNDFARRLSEELLWRGKTLQALSERQRAAVPH